MMRTERTDYVTIEDAMDMAEVEGSTLTETFLLSIAVAVAMRCEL
jgi:hypothetical protein